MKKILVPTDFSENSRIAYQYAMELAQQLNAQLTVANIYHPSATVVNEQPLPIAGELLQINRERLDNFVAEGIEKNKKDGAVSVQVVKRVEIGFAVDRLIELSKSGEYDLMVMGATGETGLLEKVFGKVSLSVAERSDCPVMLIPSDTSFAPIKKIMYATNFASKDIDVLTKIEKLSRNLNGKVHLVHVSETPEEVLSKKELIEIEENFQSKLPGLELVLNTVISESLSDGLELYAAEHSVDWMVIVKPHLNFWQRLTHISQTNPIVMNPKVPLIVMH